MLKIRSFCLWLLLTAVAIGGLLGCATASGTVQELQVQTTANRQLLALERQRTSDLLSRRAGLQAQLNRKKQVLAGMRSSPSANATSVSSVQREVQALEREVAALSRTIGDLD
jgi:chromosome segregation ATPase